MPNDDDNYAWLDRHSTDPRVEGRPMPPPPPGASQPLPDPERLPDTSPDGTVSYISTDVPATGSYSAVVPPTLPTPPPPPAVPPGSSPTPTPPIAQPPGQQRQTHLPPQPHVPQPGLAHAPGTQHLPSHSPDGSVTYTSTDNTSPRVSIGHGPAPGANMTVPPPPPPTGAAPRRAKNYGSAGKRKGRGGILGFLGRIFRIRLALFAIGLVISGVLWLFGVNEGTTRAGSIDPGECFEMPEEGRVDRLVDMDCALPHQAQVFAEVTAFGSDRDAEVEEKCWTAWLELSPGTDVRIPDDAHFSYLEGRIRHSCAVVSPSGQLVGVLVD